MGSARRIEARWEPTAAWIARHVWPKGESPRENHPEGYGKLEFHDYGLASNEHVHGMPVAVHSTKRRKDGWSYHVVEVQHWPIWVSYYHHAATGKRIGAGHSSTNTKTWPIARRIAELFGVQ